MAVGLGLAEDMTIIVYDGAGLFAAPRVRWMLRTMGAKDVASFGAASRNGSGGRPTTSGTPSPEPRIFPPRSGRKLSPLSTA